jgi:hypothetical protein
VSARALRSLGVVVLLGLVARIAMWWTQGGFHYPDEIFQQLEPASYLRTGVAWLPWELARGARSWVLPGYYAALLETFSWFGIEGLSAQRAVTLHNALLSLVMIPAGYRIGVALWPSESRDSEWAGIAVAVLTALLPTLVYYTPHTLNGTPSMILLSWGYAYWLEARRSNPTNTDALLRCGLMFGAACALRITTGVYVLVPLVDLFWQHRQRALKPLLVGAAAPLLFVGMVDWLTWGWPFHSFVQYVQHHLFEAPADRTRDWPFYFVQSLWTRFGPLAPLSCALLLASLRRAWLLALAVLLPTVLLSFVPLKQDRFLMNNWPLLAAMLGLGLLVVARWMRRRSPRFALAAVPALATVILASNLVGTRELPWTEHRGIFRAQSFVGSQADATGLLFQDRRHLNGGYLVFNRTVPQVQYRRALTENPLFNYAALDADSEDARHLLRMSWEERARFDEIIVLERGQTPRSH